MHTPTWRAMVHSIVVREASDADSAGLLTLERPSVVRRGVRWVIERNPDFFVRFRAETGGWRVLVAEDEAADRIVGSVSVVLRDAYVAGRVRPTAYASTFLVHPEYRRQGIGDRLHRRAAEVCSRAVGDDGLVLTVIREGNREMRRRIPGPRGLPAFGPFARVSIHSIRTRSAGGRDRRGSLEIRSAVPPDTEEMADLARRVFAERQFGPAFDGDSLERWIEGAPGLAFSDHLVAREGGVLVGWFGLWNDAVIRTTRLAAYSRVAAARRFLHDALTPISGRPHFPKVGDAFRCAAIVHPCIPQHRPDVLRAMIARAAARLHDEGCARLTIALDLRDGLNRALRGLRTGSSSFGACVTTPEGSYGGPPLGDRPVHFEAALV